jgi:tRNA (guanine-N7-)-methyltransferase
MRQRRIKDVETKLTAFNGWLIDAPERRAGAWRTAFAFPSENHLHLNAKLYVEIGCGKGRFVTSLARRESDALCLGFEGQQSVLYRALQRACLGPAAPTRGLNDAMRACAAAPPQKPPANLRFCAAYILDMKDFFAEDEISGIYLNFSDPWPKSRQEKRRLTSPRYLDGYAFALAEGGFLRFKTDNEDFFAYSHAALAARDDFRVVAETDDLHASPLAAANIETEYELRFLNLHRPIHYLEARRK